MNNEQTNKQTDTAEMRRRADEAYKAGRCCIGCQAIDIETNWAGYCDECLANFEKRAAKHNGDAR